MIELIMKMVACLLVALLLGFIIGWLLNKIFKSKKHLLEIEMLSGTLADKNKEIASLENKSLEKETVLLKFNDENRELKASLANKKNLLDTNSANIITMEEQLTIAKSSLNQNQNTKKQNEALHKKIKLLDQEMQELEMVLIKAEETIEEKDKLCSRKEDELTSLRLDTTQESSEPIGVTTVSSSDKRVDDLNIKIEELTLVNKEKSHSIELYQNTINELENELKLYSINGEDDEFVISKDQFTHIEEQLVEYQKEIKQLKEENGELAKKSGRDELLNKESSSDLDDIAIVKLFRETYKKITKS